MGHELPHADGFFPIGLELRPIIGNGGTQDYLPLLHKLHDSRRRSNHLGQRGHVEDRVNSHRQHCRNQGAMPEGFAVDDLSLAPDDHHGARTLAGANCLLSNRSYSCQLFSG